MSMPIIETVITIDELVPNGSNNRHKVQVKLYSLYLFVHAFLWSVRFSGHRTRPAELGRLGQVWNQPLPPLCL